MRRVTRGSRRGWWPACVLPTPPFGLATTITGMHAPPLSAFAVMLAALGAVATRDCAHGHPPNPSPSPSQHRRRRPRSSSSSPIPQLEQSRVNRRLLTPPRAAGAATGRVEVRDLYALYPDYLIDVAAEQAALAGRRLVVWQHPIHWYSHAAADEAVGRRGARLRLGLRPRRHTRCAARTCGWSRRTGGAEDSYRPDSYNRYFFDAFLPPYEQTAALCGMRFLPPLVLHGAHRAQRAPRSRAHADVYAQRLAELPGLARARRARRECVACEVPPTTARPRRPLRRSRLMEHDPPGSPAAWSTSPPRCIAVPLARLLGLGSIIGYLPPAS